jgi:hypothetical protein
MSEIYNPWAQPPETGTLEGEFATPEYDADESMPDMPMEATGEQLEQALEVIQQQSEVIQMLMENMGNT